MLERRVKQGLRVLVTAGASGIGRAITTALIEDGARVHICDIAEPALAECRGALPQITASLTDVADPAAVDRLFDDVRRELGGLDVLVNNAGIAGPTGGIDEIDPAAWRRTVDVNLNGQFYCARLAVPLLREAGDGAIINLSSVAGRLGYAYRTPYSATKWAVIGLTESLAIELGPSGIRVNALLPGIVEGPRIEGVIQARATQLGLGYPEMEQRYLEKISLRRMVTAEDVASMVLFLCSPAGRNVSGQALSICGNVETL
ncbi:MAG TPA: SDR family oxidoreductase [Stellaceae bacterium]|nr:SDR family oxidoreductase [Stellaceae bacterium]